MFAVLHAHWLKLKRDPSVFLLMLAMTVLFALVLGVEATSTIKVQTFQDDTITETDAAKWMELLNRSDTFEFVAAEEAKALAQVAAGHARFALRLMPDNYTIVSMDQNEDVHALDYYVRSVYEQELILRQAEVQSGRTGVRAQVEERLASPALYLEISRTSSSSAFSYDPRVQSVIGFTLFFVIYTITLAIQEVLIERRNGIWDRLILSPMTKTAMYCGHLSGGFLIGYVQITIVFVLFRYVFGFPFGDRLGSLLLVAGIYTFAIVALGMMLASVVRTQQQMSVLVPIVAVSFAMIGGAYWPLEIVTHPVLLGLSKLVPVTYGMEAMKGIIYHDHSWSEWAFPAGWLLLFGVVCMGIGIHLMERRGV